MSNLHSNLSNVKVEEDIEKEWEDIKKNYL
jgi:hypothetical protein